MYQYKSEQREEIYILTRYTLSKPLKFKICEYMGLRSYKKVLYLKRISYPYLADFYV